MNSQLTIAAHVLGMIAFIERAEDRLVTSSELAASIGTNPVVVRRVLGQLARAGLVQSKRGPNGGSTLGRPAHEITLRDAYDAVSAGESMQLIARHPGTLGPSCRVAPVLAAVLDELYADAEELLLQRLGQVDVDRFSREVVRRLRGEA